MTTLLWDVRVRHWLCQAAAAGCCFAAVGCASDYPQPLTLHTTLVSDVAALDRTIPDGPAIPANRPLTPAQVGLLAVRNSPDLRAARAKRGVAEAQVFEAGLMPDPVFGGSYNVLLAGPGVANAIAATLTQDITALITLSARRRAAQKSAMQVDAGLVWQEWQTISRAQTLVIDLVEQGRLLRSLHGALVLLRQRANDTSSAVRQGNATLQSLAPDVAAFTSLQTQYQAAALAQEQRWQNLDALLGLQPDVRPLLATPLEVPAIPAAEAQSMLASLPSRRPDLVALQLGYGAQEANFRAAILGQYPALSIGPNYGNDTSRVQSLGPSISVGLPLFNRNRGRVAIQRATREQLRLEYVARLDAAAAGVQALLSNLAMLERQLDESRSGVDQARALASSATGALRSGLVDERTYVDLLVTALEKERQVVGLEQQVLDDRTSLATLLGAGLPPLHITSPTGAPTL